MELEKRSEFVEFVEFVEYVESDETGTEKTESLSGKTGGQPDLRPEFCRYRDEGCEMAESCLNCPFARCIYDEPGGKQLWMRKSRDREIARLSISEGKKVKEISEMFGISERTVQRDLKTALCSKSHER